MRQNNTSSIPGTNSTRTAPALSARLTKAELVRILEGRHTDHPLTYDEFYRCSLAIVARWCHGVANNQFADVEAVKSQLGALQSIFKSR